MKNLIPKGTGNSRFLKSVSNFLNQYPSYEDMVDALVAGTLPIDLNGINSSGVTQIGTPLNKDTLLKDATAAALGLSQADPTVDDALSKLSAASLIKKVPKYQQVTLGGVAEGSIIQLNENGSPVDFYVAKHDYESGLNGTGRTLLVRKDCYDVRQWNSSGVNTWASCTLRSWLNGEYLNLLDEDIRGLIGKTKYYYTIGRNDTSITTLEDPIFVLSLAELDIRVEYANVEGEALSISEMLWDVYLNGSYTSYTRQWTRSPKTSGIGHAAIVSSAGGTDFYSTTNEFGSRPVFTLPSTYGPYYIDADGNIYTEQEYAETLTDILGVPYKGGTKFAYGSYDGTGTYGISNPNTLTFDFTPNIVIMCGIDSNTNDYLFVAIRGVNKNKFFMYGSTKYDVDFIWGYKSLSWYYTKSAIGQLNNTGNKYYYVAIG